jgi:ketosteroid isomerase-like protein
MRAPLVAAAVAVLASAFSFTFLVACSHGPTPRASQTCESAAPPPSIEDIGAVLDDFHDAAAKADETRYFDHFTTGAVFLGTDGKERWTVPDFRAYAHPYFAKGKAWSFRATRRAITVSGDVAWFDEDLDTPNLGPARGSGVVVRGGGGRWKVAQYNLSVPIPNERFKDVKALIEGGR